MVEERKSLWSRLFGPKKKSCCDVCIEELATEETEVSETERNVKDVKKMAKQSFPCCSSQVSIQKPDHEHDR